MAGVKLYASVEGLVALFGKEEMLLLAGISADPPMGEAAEVLDRDRLEKAICWASSDADSYLAVRYAVPVSPVPHALSVAVGDSARYRLTGHLTVEN